MTRIKQRLKQVYDYSLIDSLKDFHTFDSILREVLGKKADQIERNIVYSLFRLEKFENELWVSTQDPDLVLKTLDTFGDPYKRIVLESTKINPQVVFDILQKSKLPQASGYRRIRELVNDGFLMDIGVISSGDGRNAVQYKNIIEKIRIEILDSTSVKFKFFDDELKSSHIVGLLNKQKSSIRV